MHQTNTPRTQHLLPSAAANEPNCSGKRILLVEDNPLNMEIACELIGMTGAMIEEADDGAAALTKIAQEPENHYDLVFMDLQMPKNPKTITQGCKEPTDRCYDCQCLPG